MIEPPRFTFCYGHAPKEGRVKPEDLPAVREEIARAIYEKSSPILSWEEARSVPVVTMFAYDYADAILVRMS